MHGDHVWTDAFADVIRAQGTTLDEHVHLHAMTEGFMRNQAGDFRRGDDVIFPGNNALGGDQIFRDSKDFGDFVLHMIEQFRSLSAGQGGIGKIRALFSGYQGVSHSFTEGVGLAQVLMLGEEHLADVGGTGADLEVNKLQALFRSGFHTLVGNGG